MVGRHNYGLENDSIFLNNIPFHVHEIEAIRQDFTKWNYLTDGTLLIVAGVGVLVLNVVNGLYTNEKARETGSRHQDGLLPVLLLSEEYY